MTAIAKTVFTDDQERDLLRQKIGALESDRIQSGLEADALTELGDLSEQEAAELRALERASARLDARLDVHRARLNDLG